MEVDYKGLFLLTDTPEVVWFLLLLLGKLGKEEQYKLKNDQQSKWRCLRPMSPFKYVIWLDHVAPGLKVNQRMSVVSFS